MSRLIVKNLPKSVTQAKLTEVFSQKGIVTDVQLKYTKDGKFRRFCFIGFKTDEQATAARDYFDKSCIDTCRISVEHCANLGDPQKPRSWSKYAIDSSRNNTVTDKKSKATQETSEENTKDTESTKVKHNKNKEAAKNNTAVNDDVKDALSKHKDDPLFVQFLESHAVNNVEKLCKSAATKTVSDEGDVNEHVSNADEENETEDTIECHDKQKAADKAMSDLQYMETLKDKENVGTKILEDKTTAKRNSPINFFTVKIRGLGYKHKKKDIKQFFRPLKAKSIRVPRTIKGIAYVGFKSEMQFKKALQKNKSFLDGKQIFISKYEKKEDLEAANVDTRSLKWQQQEDALQNEESIAESGRLFIRNLAYTTTENDVQALFEKYGPLAEVNLPVDKVTRKLKGFGTVVFVMPEHAAKAYVEQDGTTLNGRMLHILPGKAKDSFLNEDLNGLTFKEKKELQTKATANSTYNWNTLFLGQNAVAEAMAATYKTTKEKVLEDGTKNMTAAVKLALGETQLVHDTRNFLEENNVSLDTFSQTPKKRSKNIILVKNLPAATLAEEIRNIFAPFGELGRVVLPPLGITALVEFIEPSEARKAFMKLAYTKFKHLPLYLEWAPDNSFTTPMQKIVKVDDNLSRKKTKSNTNAEEQHVNNEECSNTSDKIQSAKESTNRDFEDSLEPESDTTLFVKNIKFSTTEDQLKEHFSKCGPVHYVMVATKKDPNNPACKLSMGYGFVRYKKKSDADRALKVLQMTVLDGKSLELKRSERTLTSDMKVLQKSTKSATEANTKILVRNIPFQATIGEITELFKAFGELKAVRLPKKLVGIEKHRGFAFVEYYTKSEAKKAFAALCHSTHLYGRRLVLEWAQTEETIEDIRKRTAKQFYTENEAKRSKKSVFDPEDMELAKE